MTSAAGLAMGGMHPVVAVYSTFLNRAFDQMMMDVALHKLPVTIVLDRAGVTGPDGPSHHGVWDLSILGIVPGMRWPRRATRPGCARNGRGAGGQGRPDRHPLPQGRCGRGHSGPGTARRGGHPGQARPGLSEDVLLVAVGSFAQMGLAVAQRLQQQGIGVTVVDLRWVLPEPEALHALAAAHKLVVTVEDNGVQGGIGSSVSAALRRNEIDVPCRDVGVPQEFQDHASRSEVLTEVGLTDRNIARQITGWVAALGAAVGEQVGHQVD
jgi:1-deoxy-D-xylulose-5-phosphate synthase